MSLALEDRLHELRYRILRLPFRIEAEALDRSTSFHHLQRTTVIIGKVRRYGGTGVVIVEGKKRHPIASIYVLVCE